MRVRPAVVLAASLLLGGCGGALVAGPPDESPADLAPKVQPDAPAAKGIVRVRLPQLNQDSFRRRAAAITLRVRNLTCEGVSRGSGFAIDNRTLITNRHVVAGAQLLQVNTSDGRTFNVSAAEVGVLGDIAFVTIDGSLPVTADVKGRATPGSDVAVIGYPLGGPFTITRGVVVDAIDGTDFAVPGRIWRITAEVQPGNSGGPLLDERGRVAGIVYALERVTGLGLVIPMSTANELISQAGLEGIPPCGEE